MKDYEVAYKLSSIMESVDGNAICIDDEEQVYITIPVNRVMNLTLYGIKHPHEILFEMCENDELGIFIDDEDEGNPLIVIGCMKLIHYKKLAKLLYDFCKHIVSQTDKVTIKFEGKNEVLIGLPFLSLLRCTQKDNPRELTLLLNILSDLVCDSFGDESHESIGMSAREQKSTHIGQYYISIDFINRDEIFKDIDDIRVLSDMVYNASLKTLDIIFKDYIGR